MNKKDKISSLLNSQTNIITNNFVPKLKIDLCQSQHSISTSNSINSSYKESPKNSDLFSYNKDFNNNGKKLLNISIDDSFSSYNSLDYQNNKNYSIDNENFEKAKNAIKDLNSQLVKMNYCNLIQTNSIQRLDLSLSFLSSQIESLKLLNKKRKIKLQNFLEKIKNDDK